MQLPRFFGIIDIGIATVVVVAIVLPPRTMDVEAAAKGTDVDRFSLAFAEARTIAHPKDGALAADLSRRAGEAGFNDWAIDSALAGSERSTGTGDRWRALLAASAGFMDRHDAKEALDLVDRAISACESATERGEPNCPEWEKQPMLLYQESLQNGINSSIDPHADPAGFRRASKLKPIHIGPQPTHESTPAPADARP
jgi:hypothetical protein